jgi:serine/threonine protein phosphatase PrpC
VSSGTVQQKEQAGISLQYAWVSQRGFYPNALDKPNQDSYSVLPNFGDNMAYFAVYDGHGAEGHTCAWFVRDQVRAFMLLFLRLCRNLIVVFVFSCQMR